MHVARRGTEGSQGGPWGRRSSGPAHADLGPIEGSMECRQLHFVDGNREVPDGGPECFSLDGQKEASAPRGAIRDGARVSVDWVETIWIEVDEETIAAGVVEIL